MALGLLTAAEISQALSHLTVKDNQIVVNDIPTAKWLVYRLIAELVECACIGLYELMAQLIQTGLRVSAISESDVWLTDEELWDKLNRCPDQSLQFQLAQLSMPIRFLEDLTNPWRELIPKIRTIDPTI